jgi:hypothetical protein
VVISNSLFVIKGHFITIEIIHLKNGLTKLRFFSIKNKFATIF